MIVIKELTVPFEGQITKIREYKMAKYENLCGPICTHMYDVQLYAVEVGARGFPTQSLWALAGRLGLGPRTRDCYVNSMCNAIETSSMWIWWRKDDHDLI